VPAPDPEIARSLPLDELALKVLQDIDATREWHEGNYMNVVAQDHRYQGRKDAQQCVAEALGWLRSRGMIACPPGQNEPLALFITRAGRQALRNGVRLTRAAQQLQEGLHPLVQARARRQFLLAEYEQSVFVAMKAVEVRVRAMAGLADEVIGVDLMNKAFGPSGFLTDPGAVAGEREGTRSLFAGAYAVLRNPSGHRDVDYDEVAEAAEAVGAASLLMRILDRIEVRLKVGAQP
jgi:uncharacterized protein (TIGR02391 family)